MTALSDGGIRRVHRLPSNHARSLNIDPWNDERVKPNSYDITLGKQFKWIDRWRLLGQHNKVHNTESHYNSHTAHEGLGISWGVKLAIDPYNLPDDLYSTHVVGSESHYVLEPQSFALGHTVERITLGPQLCARLEGKSSLARLGLAIHSTAGFIDAGWDGQITLELFNFGPLPILLSPGMPIGQLFFETLDAPAAKPYGSHSSSKYHGSEGVVGSEYDKNQRP